MTIAEIRNEILRLKKLPQSLYVKNQIQKLQQKMVDKDGI